MAGGRHGLKVQSRCKSYIVQERLEYLTPQLFFLTTAVVHTFYRKEIVYISFNPLGIKRLAEINSICKK